MTDFTFINPASFDPREFLKSPKLRTRWDDARYLVGLILTKLAQRDVDKQGSVRLHATYLKNIMHQSDYAAVIESLMEGAIERFPYTVGKKSFGFRLAARFVSDPHIRVPATDSRIIRRLEKFHQQADLEKRARMKPVHLALERHQQRLQIDGKGARRKLADLSPNCNPFDTQGILIRDIEDGEYRINVGRYGRVSNNITSLKRELRDTLHVNHEPLGSVDLSCAQPAFLGKLIKDSTKDSKPDPAQGTQAGTRDQSKGKYDSSFRPGDDFDLYLERVQTGTFYEFLMGQLRDGGISRNEIKRRFLADVLAKKGRYPSVVEDLVRRVFPSVFDFVRRINRDGLEHANVIRLLQRAEADFVIETVCAELVTRYPGMFCISLHDAIFSKVGDLPKVEQAFLRAFDQIGFRMRLKLEA